jgi:hypothetical protein
MAIETLHPESACATPSAAELQQALEVLQRFQFNGHLPFGGLGFGAGLSERAQAVVNIAASLIRLDGEQYNERIIAAALEGAALLVALDALEREAMERGKQRRLAA